MIVFGPFLMIAYKSKEKTQEAPKFCPVCGPEEEMHGLAFSYKHKGKKHSFCSMDCLKAFKRIRNSL